MSLSHLDCVSNSNKATLSGACTPFLRHIDQTKFWSFIQLRCAITNVHAGKSKGKAFDGMNSIAANMLLNLTSSMRFAGPLNVDLNDLTMNLVPFPRLHFLLASMSPLAAPKDVGKLAGAPRAVDQVSWGRLCVLTEDLHNVSDS